MNTSEQIDQLATALAKAHEELANPVVNAKNPHFGNKYVDLAEGLNTIRTTFAKHGLAFVQTTSVVDDIMYLTTRLLHLSGQWLEGVYPVCRLGKPQDMGSATTYARRYSIFAMAGIAGDKDDDGEGTRKTPVDAPAKAAPPATAEQPMSAYAARKTGKFPEFVKTMRMANTEEDLKFYKASIREEVALLPESWRDELQDEYEAQLERVRALVPA